MMSDSTRGLKSPPSTRSEGAPEYFFASITNTPRGLTTMWSMFALVPGMRRSCRTWMPRSLRESSRRPRTTSPRAPVCHALVLCGSSESASNKPPILGCASRIRVSRFVLRRSYSRRADAPATPESTATASASPAPEHRTHTTDLVERSYPAQVPSGSTARHSRHSPAKRRLIIFVEAGASSVTRRS
jgi:hypothetical protein